MEQMLKRNYFSEKLKNINLLTNTVAYILIMLLNKVGIRFALSRLAHSTLPFLSTLLEEISDLLSPTPLVGLFLAA